MLASARVLSIALLLGAASACASGGNGVPDGSADAGEGGTPDGGDAGDAATDAPGDSGADGTVDSGLPDGGVTTGQIYFMSGGGGSASSSTHQLFMSVGAPQPMGEAANASYRMRLGPSAVRR